MNPIESNAALPLRLALDVPERAVRRLTKGRLILAMGGLIAEMRADGMTWEQVSARLGEAGFVASAAFIKETVNEQARRSGTVGLADRLDLLAARKEAAAIRAHLGEVGSKPSRSRSL